MKKFEAKNITFKLNGFKLKNISLSVEESETLVILGPSGSGKSVLLKLIAGKYKPIEGKLFLQEKDVTNYIPSCRKMGYVPQNYCLFPHLTVKDNIYFIDKKKDEYIEKIVQILKLEKFLSRQPETLSGGEMQRVAIARALARKPEILLLDEPFSAIDSNLRTSLMYELKEIINTLKISVIFVTHNIEEAYILSDKIAVLFNGCIEQFDYRDEVVKKPLTENVVQYFGIKNYFTGKIKEISKAKNFIKIDFEGVDIYSDFRANIKLNEKIKFCIPPQDIKIIDERRPLSDIVKYNIIQGEIKKIHYHGLYYTLLLKIMSLKEVEIKIPSYILERLNLKINDVKNISLIKRSVHIIQ